MRIGLYDVDSHRFPNLPLMKISAWHKAQGDIVEFADHFTHYDKVYVSKVFGDEYSQMDSTVFNADDDAKLADIKKKVDAMLEAHPLYPGLEY